MKEIEYFYSAHSAFAYIGHPKLLEICAAHGCKLVHRPFNLGPVIRAAGGLSFRDRTQHQVDYFFGREIVRWAQYRGLEVIDHRPTHHDNPLDLSNGMLIAAVHEGADVDSLAFALLQAHWRDDADLADRDALAKAGSSVGVNAPRLLEEALSEKVQSIHAQNTEEAIERGVFGSPTYFLEDDMFYGQDRLELIDFAMKSPFRPSSFMNPRVLTSARTERP